LFSVGEVAATVDGCCAAAGGSVFAGPALAVSLGCDLVPDAGEEDSEEGASLLQPAIIAATNAARRMENFMSFPYVELNQVD